MPGLTALQDMARLSSPSSSLPPSILLLENDTCIAIFDKYAKSKYHVLVMPRIPFVVDDGEALGARDLDSLSTLLQHLRSIKVLQALADLAAEVEEMIRDEMVKSEGFAWGINAGFHAVPSMRHLHLHVMSDDLVSPALKTKKHYNSFRPDLGFFLSLRQVTGWLELGPGVAQQRVQEAAAASHTLMATPLACFKCGTSFSNMPALKGHLDDEWKAERKEGTRARAR